MGFTFLNRVLPSFRLLIVVTTLLTCTAYFFFFYKTIPPKYSWLGITFLFIGGDKTFYFMFSGVRNAIAISILLMTITLITDRRWLKVLIISIVAWTFHSSAIMFIPLALLIGRNVSMTRRESIIWILIMIVLIITPVNSIIIRINPFVSSYFERYEGYFVEQRDSGTLAIFGGVILSVFTIYHLRKTQLNAIENTIGRLALLFNYSYFIGSLNVRVSQYFVLLFIAFSVNLYSKEKDQFLKYAYVAFSILFVAYAFYVGSFSGIYSPFISYKTSLDF